MKWHILLFLFLILTFTSHAEATTSPFPWAVITSSQGTSVNLFAEPGKRSVIYANATLHIFASTNTTYDVYLNDNLYLTNTTTSEHTEISLHLLKNITQIRVFLHPSTELIFYIVITNQPITEGNIKNVLQKMLTIPPWEWSAHEWAVFGDTVLGGILAIPFAIILTRYLILRKWGGASVIS